MRAQRALRAGKGRLLDSTGSVLDGGTPLKKARQQYVEPLMLQVRMVDICGGRMAFAAILGDGSDVTWGKYSLFLGGGSGVPPLSPGALMATVVTAVASDIG